MRERATQLARPGVQSVQFSGAAQGQTSSPAIPDGDTIDNGAGYEIHAALYKINTYDDPRAVYAEDVTL